MNPSMRSQDVLKLMTARKSHVALAAVSGGR